MRHFACAFQRAVLVLAITVLIWPQIAQAKLGDHPDDPLPLRVDDCDKEDAISQALCAVKAITNLTQKVASWYSGISGTLKAAEVVAKMLGILQEVDPTREFLAEEFKKLHEHLDKVAEALTWKKAVDERTKRISAVFDVVLRAKENTSLYQLHIQDPVKYPVSYPPFTNDSEGVAAAGEAVFAAGDKDQFLRYNNERVTDGPWKSLLPDRPGVINSHVYDWRLGVPELMQLIAMHLTILAGIDPHFKNDMVFQDRLLRHRSNLLPQYLEMIKGVKCGSVHQVDPASWETGALWDVAIACADINTGLAAYFYDRTGDPRDYSPSKISDIQQELMRQVLRQMPLFEMRSMIDTLYLYAHGRPDLTKTEQRIMLAADPNLCLEVQWGNLAPGTPVQLGDCDGGEAQRWFYDRPSGEIRNPASSLCLEVQGRNAAPGTPVQLGDCNGGEAQKWTYDPEMGVLQNALGSVLDIGEGALAAGTPVQTSWQDEESYWQHEGLVGWISEILKRGRVLVQ